jgi:SPP1 gp7 family putative phage head morphogenesis protein
MSCHLQKDTLSPYTRESGSGGPTNTFTVSKRFAQRLRGVLRRINAAIRRAIKENDIFELKEGTDTLAVDDPGPFETDSRAQMQTRFLMWLREQLQSEFLDVVGPDRNEFIEKAYFAGLRNANGQIRNLDISFVPENADSIVDRPIHQSALRELFTRTYNNLESVANDVAQGVRDELVEGFQQGEGPDKIASRLTDRIDSIGQHRATMIARSETINAHSESTLTRVDEIQEDVGGTLATTHGDWDAANDSRVCKFCHALDGVRLETEEMRGTIVTVTSPLRLPPSNPEASPVVGQTFRLKPPAHPNGRCNIGIRVGGEIEDSLEDRLPGQIQVIT